MTTDKYTGNGELEEIIAKLTDVRDSMEEILDELEEIEEAREVYRTDAPYGLPLDAGYNGED